MSLRDDRARLRRLRLMARETPLCPQRIGPLIQPFIDRYKNLRLPRRRSVAIAVRPHPQHEQIAAAILALGLELRRSHLRGLTFHNTFVQRLAKLASLFGYRGFTECYASYDTAVRDDHPGRMDTVWALERTPTVLFEIDSTVKAISLRKLQLAQAPHKYWIYFGPDIWTFKTHLRRADPSAEVTPIIIPRAWTP